MRVLKLQGDFNSLCLFKSHPTWMRVLKNELYAGLDPTLISHPTRMRVLKHVTVVVIVDVAHRILIGCVY